MVTGAALAAFAIAGRGVPATPVHRRVAIVAAALALAAAAVDLKGVDARSLAAEIETERDHISAPDLADLIMAGDSALQILDIRTPSEFARMHIPGARHASIDTLSRDPLPRNGTIVLYSEGGAHAAQAWVLLRMRGHRRVFFLREGLFEWLARVMEPRLAVDATERERADFVRAREMSRFFGGVAREGVPRAEVPLGYWNDRNAAEASGSGTERALSVGLGLSRPCPSGDRADRMQVVIVLRVRVLLGHLGAELEVLAHGRAESRVVR